MIPHENEKVSFFGTLLGTPEAKACFFNTDARVFGEFSAQNGLEAVADSQ